MTSKTDRQQLAELAYPGDLAAYVTARAQSGESWRKIARFVNSQMNGGVSVSYESLRRWYGEERAA